MRALLTLLLITPALIGCLGSGDDAMDEAADATRPLLPPGLGPAGWTLEQRNATTAHFTWTDVAQQGSAPRNARAANPATTALELAPGVDYEAAVSLTWPSEHDLELEVRTAKEGAVLCRETTSGKPEVCRLPWLPARASGAALVVEVSAIPLLGTGPGDDTTVPFTVTARVTARAPQAPLGPDGLPAAMDRLDVARATLLTDPGWAGEPSIAIGPAGTLYVTGPGSSREALQEESYAVRSSRLWVSHDHGTTFEEIPVAHPGTGVSNLPFGLEGDVVVGGDGRAYFVDETLANFQLSTSEDQGRTWSVTTPAVAAQTGVDRPWLAAGPPGTVALSWMTASTREQWISVSTDGGQTFPVQTQVTDEGGYSQPPFFDGEGTLYLARESEAGPVLWHSTDGGATFSAHPVHETSNDTDWLFVVGDADTEGNLYVAWAEDRGGNVDIYYAASSDGGEAWTHPLRVSHHQGASVMPWLAAGDDGHIAIAYYAAPGTPGRPDLVQGDWYPHLVEVHNATSPDPSLAAASLTVEPVLRGPVCVTGLNCNLGLDEGDRGLADYLNVAIDHEQRVHVAWTTTDTSSRADAWWAVMEGRA